MTTMKLTVVYEAEWQWGEITLARREVVFADDFVAECQCGAARDEVLKAAGLDPEDEETGISVVADVAPHHTAIQPGDYAANSGYGSDWIFVRASES